MCRRRACILLALASALNGCGQTRGDAAAAELRLRSTLDSLVRLAQEAHHAEHGYFAGDLARLGLTGLDPNVQVYFRAADEDGWSASVTHRGWPSRPCVLNVGDPPGYAALPTGSVIRPARVGPSGEVVCVPLED